MSRIRKGVVMPLSRGTPTTNHGDSRPCNELDLADLQEISCALYDSYHLRYKYHFYFTVENRRDRLVLCRGEAA
jgi:hypothetical protein